MDNAKVTKIVAPAGCGKTTRLLDVVETLLNRGIAPDRIVFTTFTRAGAYEARDRACLKFSLNEKQFPFFRTMHSLCYRMMGSCELMQNKDWFEIAHLTGISFSPQAQSYSGENLLVPRQIRKGDYLMSCIALARNRRITVEEAYFEYPERNRFKMAELEFVDRTIKTYKTQYGKVDFTDMLETFLARAPRMTVDALIVDEAQDLTLLQWAVIEHIASFSKEIYIAGDDDQAIYEYAGADPSVLIDLPSAHTELRTQSYRVPQRVQELSQSIVTKLTKRIDKEIVPRQGTAGEVSPGVTLESIDMSEGTWMILCRNMHFFTRFEQHLMKLGFMYRMNRPTVFDSQLFERAMAWHHFYETQMIAAGELASIVRYMKAGKEYKPGLLKNLKDLPHDAELSTNDAKELGLYRFEPWDLQLTKLSALERNTINAFIQNGDTSPRISISTIHGVKGMECENVVVCPDMTFQTWNAYNANPDPEHRLFYVAVTRAKENVFLLQPETDKHYVY